MGRTIQGTGTNPNDAGVDKAGRLFIVGTIITPGQSAVIREDNFSINSGIINIQDDLEQGVLFILNNENRDLIVSNLLVSLGPSAGGVVTDTTEVRVYKNPTIGTLISGAINSDVKSNSKFSSNVPIQIDSFKGTGIEAASQIDDGTEHGIVLFSPAKTQPFIVDQILAKGESMAVTYKAPTSNTAMKAVASTTVFLSDPLAGE